MASFSLPIVTVVGYSNSGKTRCIVALIALLTQRGYRVASARHCHDGFTLDVAGKDSWKHKHAGAVTTLMASRNRIGVIVDQAISLSLAQLCELYVHEADIVLAEGFSWEPHPKILIRGADNAEERKLPGESLIALVGESPFTSDIPFFTFHEMDALASLLEQHLLSVRKEDSES